MSSPSPSPITSFIRWLRLKNYQYEVTFSLYMLTPTEKLIFNFLLLVVISMLLAAAYVYLPDHVMTICNRIWYYWAGDPFTTDYPFFARTVVTAAKDLARGNGRNIQPSSVLASARGEGFDMAYETAKNAAETMTAPARNMAEL